MSFADGENVGAYRVVARLGQGGMATVFKAYHPGLDRYVALKVLHPAFKEDPGFVQRFNREARIVARLEHPNIVPVYDYAEHRGLAYLVMRFVEGETLKAHLNRGRLRPEQIVQVVEGVGAALSYAHGQGILHRDVKPSNILLSDGPAPEGADGSAHVFLGDFGLARIAEAGESTLSRDMMMGTPQYISPEQAKGRRDLDAATDIYSFGVVVFEMITGRVPFSSDTPYSIIHDHIFTPLPVPTSINPNIPATVERVLLKALAKEPADRYADVDSLVSAFVGAVESSTGAEAEPVVPTVQVPLRAAEGVPQVQEVEKPEEKRRRGWLYAGIGMALLCLCAAVLLGGTAVERIQANATATARSAAPPPGGKPPGDEGGPSGDADLAERIEALEEHVRQNPDDAMARMELGFLYLKAGAREEGEDQLREAIELRPEEEAVYLEVGRYLLENEQPKLAAEVFATGLEVLPESLPLRFSMGRMLWGLGSPDGDLRLAEELARRLVETHPRDAMFHAYLARVLIGMQDMDQARAEIDRALELDPNLAAVHLVQGLWFRQQREFAEARREFQIALDLGIDEEWLRREVERELDKTEP